MNVMNTLSRLDPRNLVSDLVQNTVQGLTGSENLGQLAGLLTDLKTGNVLGAFVRGTDLVQSSARDFQVEAELRWGPGAHKVICGPCGGVAESCPAPGSQLSLDYSFGIGVLGWSVSITIGSGGEEEMACQCASPGLRSVLDDPSLSLEAKVALLFAEIIDELDEQIEGKLRDMESASKAGESDKAAGGDGESAANDFNKISTEVQMLMQKRSQMYGLQSNMMSMFNDVSMQIIGNVR